MKRRSPIGLIAVCTLALASPGAAQAADSWEWTGVIYGYLPAIGGKTTFQPGDSGASDIHVDANKILSGLKFAYMGSLDASNGRWGGFADLVYADVGDSESATRDFSVGEDQIPVGITADAHLDVKTTIWTLGATWRAVNGPGATMDIFAGVRGLDTTTSLDWRLSGNIGSVPIPAQSGIKEESLRNWDGIVGAKGRVALGESGKWFVPYYVDVGAGNSSSTWQAMGGIAYAFRWGGVAAAWRHIDYKMKSGSPIQSLNFDGPAIAAVFHW